MSNNIFTYFYNLSNYPFVVKAALFASYKLIYIIPILMVLWVIFFAKRKIFTFNLLFLSCISAWVVSAILKVFFHTVRPFTELGFIPIHFETSFSFPSQHAAIFSALAVSMFLVNKRFAVILCVLAVLIGISRIILGVHYPVDVIGGFALGTLVGALFIKLFKRI